MAKKNARTLRFTDSLLISEHPGGDFESSVALDIFNDPRSWGSDTSMVDEKVFMKVEEEEKEEVQRVSLTRTGSEKARRPKPEEVLLRPFTSLKVRPRRASISSSTSSEAEIVGTEDKGGNFEALLKVLEPTGKDLSLDLKRISSLWSHGNLFRAFPSPLDAPVSAARPFTPLSASKKRTLATPTSSVGIMSATLSATWDMLRSYTATYTSSFSPQSAGLPPPRSAMSRLPATANGTHAVRVELKQQAPPSAPSKTAVHPLPPTPKKRAIRPLPAIPTAPVPPPKDTPIAKVPMTVKLPMVIPNPPAYSPIDPHPSIPGPPVVRVRKTVQPLNVAKSVQAQVPASRPSGGISVKVPAGTIAGSPSARFLHFPSPPKTLAPLPPPNLPLPAVPPKDTGALRFRSKTIKEDRVTPRPLQAPRARSELHQRRRNTPFYHKVPMMAECVPF